MNGTNGTGRISIPVVSQSIGDPSTTSGMPSMPSMPNWVAPSDPASSAQHTPPNQQPQSQQQQLRKRPEAPLPAHAVMSQTDFLASYRAPLIAAVAQSAPPIYQGPAMLPSAHLGLLLRKPLGAQRLALFAAACGLRGQRPTKDPHTGAITDPGWRRSAGLGLIFEMGTGKTYCALAALALADEEVTRRPAPPDRRPEKASFFPAIVLCPPIMQEKWAREAAMTLPTARPVILRPITTREEAAAFRRFDPSFSGKKLSAIGVCDRVARRIQRELAQWRVAREQALAQGKRPPRKPCHTVVISQSTAKFGIPWTPVYALRVLREWSAKVDPETGQKVTKIRGQRDPETGALVTVPCCPHCYTPIVEDERHANARERRARKAQQAKKANKIDSGNSGSPGANGVTDAADLNDVVVGDEDELDGFVDDLPYLSEADLLGIGRTRSKHTCTACDSPLWQNVPEGARWQATPPPREGDPRSVAPLPIPDRTHRITGIAGTANRRYPIADYLRKRYRGLFRSLIADEAHQYQGAGTAQGYAAASLVDACGPQGTAIALTGTLFSGYASTLFWMLWRLMPSIRAHFGYEEAGRWVGRYGLRQKTVKVEESSEGTTGWRSKRKDATPRYRELPGISPLVLNLLLPHCLFMDLADVAPDLPLYREEVVTIPLGPNLEQEYQRFQREATDNLKAQLQLGDNSGTSSWFHGLLIWPNLPCQEIVARAKRTGVELGRAPALAASAIYPKERALLDLVRRERAEGRRCLVYVEHTGEHDLLPRLTQLLQDDDAAWRAEDPEDHPGTPLRVVTLRGETVATGQREAWLAKQVEVGCDVLLCHSGLVEVGLDLLAFPTIMVYEIIFSTTRWRQAIRRSWRPGQTREVRVIQLTYEQTMEARGLTLIATKAIASLMVEGKMPSAALNEHAQNSATTNLIMELFQQVISDVEHPGLADGITRSSENAYQADELEEAQHQRLSNAAPGAMAEALRTTFLALSRVEQEAEAYIGAGDAGDGDAGDLEPDDVEEEEEDDENDETDVRSGRLVEASFGTLGMQGIQTPTESPRETRQARSPGHEDLRMDQLWGLEIRPINPDGLDGLDTTQAQQDQPAHTAPLALPPHPTPPTPPAPSAPSHTMLGQNRVSWDELRAQLQAEAANRKAKRRSRSASAGHGIGSSGAANRSVESGSLWAVSARRTDATPGNPTGDEPRKERRTTLRDVATPAPTAPEPGELDGHYQHPHGFLDQRDQHDMSSAPTLPNAGLAPPAASEASEHTPDLALLALEEPTNVQCLPEMTGITGVNAEGAEDPKDPDEPKGLGFVRQGRLF